MQKFFRHSDPIFIAVICFAVLAAFFTFSPYCHPTPPRDSGIFIHIGSQLLQGKVLYLDTWDNKQPLLYFLNALGLWLGGKSVWGVWGLEAALILGMAVLSYRTARRFLAPFTAFFVVIASFLTVFQFMLGNYSEEYALVLQMGILAVLFQGYLPDRQAGHRTAAAYWMGILAGLAFLLKPTYLDVALAVAALFVLQGWLGKMRHTLRHIFLMLAGFLTVNAAAFIYFLSQGALKDYVNDAFLFAAHYVDRGLKVWLLSLLDVLEFNYTHPFLFILIAAWIGLVLALTVRWRAGSRGWVSRVKPALAASEIFQSGPGMLVFLGLIDLPLVILTIAVSGRNFSHYYISLYPALFLILGGILGLAEKSTRMDSNRVIFRCALAAFLVFGSYEPALVILNTIRKPALPDERSETAAYLKANTDPGDKILVWGWEAVIYYLADREPPTRYAIQYPAYFESPYRLEALQEINADIRTDPPLYIADTNDVEMPLIQGRITQNCLAVNPLDGEPLHEIVNYICKNYRLEKIIGSIQIYIHNE